MNSILRLKMKHGRLLAVLVMAMIWCLPGLVSRAQAQRYPFFVQPISVESLRELARELELSREQQAALLPVYSRYQGEFEQLQENDVSDLFEQGMTMGRSMWSWQGGNFSIPPRKDLDDVPGYVRELRKGRQHVD